MGRTIKIDVWHPEDEFWMFDYWEEKPFGVTYPREEFTADYGRGPRVYKWKQYQIKNTGKLYMVARENYTEAELVELLPYCLCLACLTRMTCHCCSGCVVTSSSFSVARARWLRQRRITRCRLCVGIGILIGCAWLFVAWLLAK